VCSNLSLREMETRPAAEGRGSCRLMASWSSSRFCNARMRAPVPGGLTCRVLSLVCACCLHDDSHTLLCALCCVRRDHQSYAFCCPVPAAPWPASLPDLEQDASNALARLQVRVSS
jgi:hypothetical protein